MHYYEFFFWHLAITDWVEHHYMQSKGEWDLEHLEAFRLQLDFHSPPGEEIDAT